MPARDPRRLLILGTGALAKLVGARLARTGRVRVTLAGTWPAALEAMGRDGITVEDTATGRDEAVIAAGASGAAGGVPDGVWTLPVEVSHRHALERRARFDVVLVLVKSHQTRAVAPVAARHAAPDGIVVTLQNGLGNAEILRAALGSRADRVVVGVTTMGASDAGPARVRAAGAGETTFGTTDATRDKVLALAALWRAAGMPAAASEAVDRLVWRKLAVNCAINPVSALAGVANGALLDDPGRRALLVAAAREVGAVAAALGVDLGADPAALALDVAARTASNRSSMLQDIDRGAPTEIEALSGAVVAAGARAGVPTPVNARLLERVRAMEGSAPRRDGTLGGATRRSATETQAEVAETQTEVAEAQIEVA